MKRRIVPIRQGQATGEWREGLGVAVGCSVGCWHEPVPLRFVWHHVLPQACGGKTVVSNMLMCCDNCHYGIHVLLYDLKVNGGELSPRLSRFTGTPRYKVAKRGYDAAVKAGTVDAIPKEAAA